jgi:hypothetical protein
MPSENQALTEARQRRRMQNRIAQRKHRVSLPCCASRAYLLILDLGQRLQEKRNAQKLTEYMIELESVNIVNYEGQRKINSQTQSPTGCEDVSVDSMLSSRRSSPETEDDPENLETQPIPEPYLCLNTRQYIPSFTHGASSETMQLPLSSQPQDSLGLAQEVKGPLDWETKLYFPDIFPSDSAVTKEIGVPLDLTLNKNVW